LFFIHRKISAAVLLIICPKNLGRVKKCEVITMMATRQDKSARSCSVYDLLLFGDDDKADFRLQYVVMSCKMVPEGKGERDSVKNRRDAMEMSLIYFSLISAHPFLSEYQQPIFRRPCCISDQFNFFITKLLTKCCT
jgi:hypothetical protein